MAHFWRKKKLSKQQKDQPHQEVSKGISLIEALVAMVIVTIVVLGLAPLLDIGTRATDINARDVELLNAARQKIEEIHQIMAYDAIGIDVATGTVSGPAYFETDPIYAGDSFSTDDDFLLSDTVTLSTGITATRTITVEAVDDPADGTGTDDWDQIIDPRTATILDYKQVTVAVSATDPLTGASMQQQVVTIIRGVLDSEVDGSTGEDSGAGKDAKKKGDKGGDAKKGDKGGDGKDGKGKGRDGKSDITAE